MDEPHVRAFVKEGPGDGGAVWGHHAWKKNVSSNCAVHKHVLFAPRTCQQEIFYLNKSDKTFMKDMKDLKGAI